MASILRSFFTSSSVSVLQQARTRIVATRWNCQCHGCNAVGDGSRDALDHRRYLVPIAPGRAQGSIAEAGAGNRADRLEGPVWLHGTEDVVPSGPGDRRP